MQSSHMLKIGCFESVGNATFVCAEFLSIIFSLMVSAHLGIGINRVQNVVYTNFWRNCTKHFSFSVCSSLFWFFDVLTFFFLRFVSFATTVFDQFFFSISKQLGSNQRNKSDPFETRTILSNEVVWKNSCLWEDNTSRPLLGFSFQGFQNFSSVVSTKKCLAWSTKIKF